MSEMIRVFLMGESVEVLWEKDFSESKSMDCERHSYLVDWSKIPLTVKISAQDDHYDLQAYLRENSGNWENWAYKDSSVIMFGEEIDLEGKDFAYKLNCQTSVAMRQLERYLDETHFWDNNERPDLENGGLLVDVDDGEVTVKVVHGKERPDLKGYTGAALASDSREATMIRPYKDEAMANLREKLFGSEKAKEEKESHPEEENADENLLDDMPRFYAGMDALNNIIHMDIDEAEKDLAFAVEAIEMPFTVVYTPATPIARKIARNLSGLPGIDDADAFLLFFERSVMGSSDLGMKGALTIKHGGEVQGGAAVPSLGNNMGPFYKAMMHLNAYLQKNGSVYSEYQALDNYSSGMMITFEDEEPEFESVSGKDRPDLVCYSMDLQYMFASEKPSEYARPYADDVMEQIGRETMSLEEKKEAAEDGDTDFMEELALAYLNGDEDEEIEKDPEKAYIWMKRLAEAGVSNGMFNLGLFYAKGFGTKRYFDKAIQWMEKAEEAGDTDAPVFCARLREINDNQEKAEKGDAKAQAELAKGLMQLGGTLEQAGPEKDYEESVKWAKKAADQGNTDGMYILALAYEHGRGVEEDKEKATDLYQKGAELGNASCMHNLGCQYMNGENGEPNEKKAFELFKQAAELGDGLAMRELGRCYQFGTGCNGNMKKAVEWYEKALEKIDDPELEQKTAIFKMMGEGNESWGEDYENETEVENVIDPEEEKRLAEEEEERIKAEIQKRIEEEEKRKKEEEEKEKKRVLEEEKKRQEEIDRKAREEKEKEEAEIKRKAEEEKAAKEAEIKKKLEDKRIAKTIVVGVVIIAVACALCAFSLYLAIKNHTYVSDVRMALGMVIMFGGIVLGVIGRSITKGKSTLGSGLQMCIGGLLMGVGSTVSSDAKNGLGPAVILGMILIISGIYTFIHILCKRRDQ